MPDGDDAPPPTLKPPIGPADHVRGADGAPVGLVEYGDFECAHCAKAAAVLDDLRAEFGDRVRVVFRHFPLGKIHPLARRAAEAAEAAAAQGKFWEMHDALYAATPAIAGPDLSRFAADLGLDVARFEAELAAGTHAARVQADVAGGARSGVNGTPTFFVNGVRHNAGPVKASLRAAIKALLPAAGPP